MKPKILIEVKGGTIIFIGATQDIDITLLDHDWEEPAVSNLEADLLMTREAMDNKVNAELA